MWAPSVWIQGCARRNGEGEAGRVLFSSCTRKTGIVSAFTSGVAYLPSRVGLGAGLAMGSDSQANGDHLAPPPAESAETVSSGETGDVSSGIRANGNHHPAAAEAVEAVEEGETGEVSSDIQGNGNYQSQPLAEAVEAVKEGDAGEAMEGVASIALLPSGAISGHFIRLPDSICYGLHGTPISCERECSRGEDYRLIKLTIIDFKSKREKVIVVECRGHDAARLQNVDHLHGWEEDIIGLVEKKHGNRKVLLSFECETLKADKDAEEHITKYIPNLCGLDAVVNVGKMSISGINLNEEDEPRGDN